MRCPWELLNKDTLQWQQCSEGCPHEGLAHKIGNFVLSTEALERLSDKGLAIVRKV